MFDLRKAPKFAGIEDVSRIEEWMLQNPPPFSTTFELLDWAVENYRDVPALKYLKTGKLDGIVESYSYYQFRRKIIQTANAFAYVSDDKPIVSLLLPNLPETVFSIWGAQACGTVSPLNSFLESDHLVSLMNSARSNILVVQGPNRDEELWRKTVEIVQNVPSLKAIYVIDEGVDVKDLEKQTGLSVFCFSSEISKQNDKVLGVAHKNEDFLASYFHTGGTTGAPKIACHTHKNELANALSVATVFPGSIGDVCFVGLPLFHVNAVIGTGIATILKGQTILLGTASGFRSPDIISNFWELVEHHNISMFSCVPTVLNMLLGVGIGTSNIRSLETVICGAAPLTKTLAERFRAAVDVDLIEGYGLTEGSCVSTLTPPKATNPVGTIGFRLPGQEIRIVRLNDQCEIIEECPIGTQGNLVIRGDNVFSGYLDKTKNAGVLLRDGWLNTGDLGTIDANGYLWLTGREKDVIIRGGHNIDPAGVEEVLMQHPDVSEAAAVGQPDIYAGEIPCAYVTLRDGIALSPQSLIEFVATNISEKASIPKDITVLNEMPLTEVGKIFKPALRNLATQRVITNLLSELDQEVEVRILTGPKFSIQTNLAFEDVKRIIANFGVKWVIQQ